MWVLLYLYEPHTSRVVIDERPGKAIRWNLGPPPLEAHLFLSMLLYFHYLTGHEKLRSIIRYNASLYG